MGGRGAVSLSYQGRNGGSGKAFGEPVLSKIDAIDDAIRRYPSISRDAEEAMSQLDAVKGGVRSVKVYRAAPDSGINSGDWVFLSRKQAERWQKTPFGRRKVGSNGKPFNVIAAEVPVSHVNWTGKNLEFAYVGKRVVDRTVT